MSGDPGRASTNRQAKGLDALTGPKSTAAGQENPAPCVALSEGWQPVATMPERIYCRTKREGEKGENVSLWVDNGDGDREYWDREGYSTKINPGTFAEPTHWQPLTGRKPGDSPAIHESSLPCWGRGCDGVV